jgi:hypothetical protein
VKEGNQTLEIDPIIEFGYLTITTDAKTLNITFKTAAPNTVPVVKDTVTLNLKNGVLLAGGAAATGKRSMSSTPGRRKTSGKGKRR